MKEVPNPNFEKKSENGSPNRISSSGENRVRKKRDYESDEIRVIPPKLPREFIHIVRPAYLTKDNSIVSLTSKLANTVKDTTDETISSIKQLAGPLVDNNVEDKLVESHDSTIQQHVSTENKDLHDVISIEKKWITKKTKIEVPVLYERVFVNDQ